MPTPPSPSSSLSSSSCSSSSSRGSISVFPPSMWATQTQLTRASTLDSPPRSRQMVDRPAPVRAVSDLHGAGLAPALPESPEIIVRSPKVMPGIPRNGTRSHGPPLGLAFVPPKLTSVSPTNLPTAPLTAVHTPTGESGWPSAPLHTQPLPPLPRGARASLGTLGRKLPPTLTESLELLVQVREHCRELERLRSVPEEVSVPSPCPSPSPLPRHQRLNPVRRGSHNAVSPPFHPPPVVRRATEPAIPHVEAPAWPPRLNRAGSSSSSSSASGDWPETPRTSVYGVPSAAESMPVLNRPVEGFVSTADLRDLKSRARAAQAMRSMVSHETPKDRPSVAKLMYASELQLLDEDGKSVTFGSLVDTPSHSRTIVVFVRHWLSPSCATYLRSLIAELTPSLLARSRARVVLIGHGAASMIRGFRQHLNCPFPVFTDPSRRLHDVLELAPRAHGSFKSEFASSSLSRAKDMLLGAARMHGLRAGNRAQLGGEFVFEGGLRVLFTHRMMGDGDHAPVGHVVDAVSAPIQRPPRARVPRRSSMYVSQTMGKVEPRASYSSTSLVDPHAGRLVFPHPPIPISPTSKAPIPELASGNEEDMNSKSPYGTRTIHPEDLDRLSGELRELCAA